MMMIRIRESGEVVTEFAFRALHANVSFPQPLPVESLDEYGADFVRYTPPPSVTITQNVAQDGVGLVAGQWQTKWVVSDKPPEQLQTEAKMRVPLSVTMRQARLALLDAGLLSSVDAAINAMPSPQKEAAQIEWEYSGEVWRDKALVKALGPALGLTDAQLDALFIAAADL